MKIKLPDGHSKPITRRDFIAQGWMAASGLVLAPSVLGLFSRSALAGDCGPPPANLMPFLVFDCVGGAGLSGNWLVGKHGGPEDYLKSYDQMGVPKNPSAGEPVDAQFGAPMYTTLSKVREGLIATTSAEARTNLRMGTLCNASQDDSSENMLSPLSLVSQAGAVGRFLSMGLGTVGSSSGGNSKGPIEKSNLKPLLVNGHDDVIKALSYGPDLETMSVRQRTHIGKALQSLSRRQAERLSRMTHGAELAALAECGYTRAIEYASPVSGLDPRLDPHCQAIYGLQPSSGAFQTKLATITYNVLRGNTGPGVITIAGCDYHDGTQATGDAKDLEIGQTIGRAVELAHRMKRPLFFAVVSDGSVYSDPGTRVWRGDGGTKGLAVIGFYHPAGAPKQIRRQIGHYTDGQGVERTTYIGGDPRRTGFAIFANYLAANGQIGKFPELVPERDFSRKEIDAHLIFG